MARKQPNILILWGDDIGQFNISAYNHGMMGFRTPNIDRIAKEGALFTDWYDQQSCTAGRAAFITGQSPIRTVLKQAAHGLQVWIMPFEELRAPFITNLRMDPFELAQDIGMDYGRWFAEHMFAFAPAGAFVGRWLQSFREFPPRQKPGSFNLDRVMEAVTAPHKGAN